MVALFLAGIAVSALSGAFAYFLPVVGAVYAQTGQAGRLGPQPGPRPSAGAAATAAQGAGAPFTVLLLGSDDDSKFQADAVLTQSMILVRIDPAAKHVTMLSIPRDLWVPLATGGSAKIDLAYSMGGAGAAIATVERNFGIHVDEWAWIGLKGLVKLIDYLGGVDVTTSNPVLDDFYPADVENANPYAYKRVAVMPGPQHLDGLHALEYVRSRHGDILEDFGRSQRQQQVLLALRTKARAVNVSDLPGVVAAFRGEFKTSFDLGNLGRDRALLALASSITDPSQIEQIVLVPPYTSDLTVQGQQALQPHWNLILPLVRQHFV